MNRKGGTETDGYTGRAAYISRNQSFTIISLFTFIFSNTKIMKRTILFSIGLFACMATAGAQDVAQNYVLRRTMLDEAGTGSMDNVTYYDGLGRPALHVGLGAAPDGKNLLTLQ